MGIGKKLSEILDSKGSNPHELAEKTGISTSTIYSIIKRDNTKIDIQILFKICEALNVSAETFYSDYFSTKEKSSPDEWESLKSELMQLPEPCIDEIRKYIKYLIWKEQQE